MTAFLDTNVLIDVIARREPFFGASRQVLSLCLSGEIDGCVSDLTFCNLAYVMRRELGVEALRENLQKLKSGLRVCPVGEAVITKAIDGFDTDFEDEVQRLCAEANGAEVIVTRDKDGFAKAEIPVLTPKEFLALRTPTHNPNS